MATWVVWVAGGFGSYRWFVYITTLLLREASWLLHRIVGHPNPASALSILLVLLEPHCLSQSQYQCPSQKGRWVDEIILCWEKRKGMIACSST